ELLTGVLDWLLGINVNRSLARPIYATTPIPSPGWTIGSRIPGGACLPAIDIGDTRPDPDEGIASKTGPWPAACRAPAGAQPACAVKSRYSFRIPPLHHDKFLLPPERPPSGSAA
ncbi:MAG: hypothetical protein VB135_05365, partial [Burkholderia sp.]